MEVETRENGGFFHSSYLSRSTGCRCGALYHPSLSLPPLPPSFLYPSIYIEPNRWSIRWRGKIVHGPTHPWRNIESRSTRFEYKMDYPLPSMRREEKRNICSGVNAIWRGGEFKIYVNRESFWKRGSNYYESRLFVTLYCIYIYITRRIIRTRRNWFDVVTFIRRK